MDEEVVSFRTENSAVQKTITINEGEGKYMADTLIILKQFHFHVEFRRFLYSETCL